MERTATQTLLLLLFLGLLSGLARTERAHRCYASSELSAAAERKLRSHYPQPPEPAAAAASASASAAATGGPPRASCPLQLYEQLPALQEYKDRSLSPWRYELLPLPDHFPSSVVRAACLCSGCVQFRPNGSAFESFDFNSVAVRQSRVVLRRERCDDDAAAGGGGGAATYRLTPVSLDVPVACTCVRARSTS